MASYQPNPLTELSLAFLSYLSQWNANLPVVSLTVVLAKPAQTALVSVDIIHGFCYEGALASPRVAGIVAPIVTLMQSAWTHGLRHILLMQDTHEPDAVEFGQFPPHCVRGTAEAEPVAAFKQLPFFDEMIIIEKNSIASGLNTGLNGWLDSHAEIDTFIVVGDCTDLCIYQMAMHLRLDANARQLQRRVLLPANCVQTYDMPVETAQAIGAMPHPGDLLHQLSLYHMALNGVEVVAHIGN